MPSGFIHLTLALLPRSSLDTLWSNSVYSFFHFLLYFFTGFNSKTMHFWPWNVMDSIFEHYVFHICLPVHIIEIETIFQVWLSNVASCRDSNNNCRICMRVYLKSACWSTHNFNFSSADLSIASPDFSFSLCFVYKIFFFSLCYFLFLLFSIFSQDFCL